MLISSLGVIAGVILAGIWPKFGEDPLENQFPLEAKGNLHFQTDAVLFFQDEAPALEVLVAIPSDKLGSIEGTDSLHVEVGVAMLDHDGEVRARYRTEMKMTFPEPDSTESEFPVPGRWVRLRPPWFPGTAGLEVRVEDLTRVKRGLFDHATGKHPYGVAAARLPLSGGRQLPADQALDEDRFVDVSLSGILFVWGQAESPETSGTGMSRIRSQLRPNPYRYYGLFQPVMTAYWERYRVPAETGLGPGDEVDLVMKIVSLSSDEEVYVQTERVGITEEPGWDLKRVDVSSLLSGSYRLEVEMRDGEIILDRTASPFQVLWERSRWVVDAESLQRYARVLLDPSEYEEFEFLDRGGRESFLRAFWNRHHPTSPGQSNPLERKFLDRVRQANDRYSSFQPGIESDRGRVHIRYGQPDEVTLNLNPQDRELLYFILPGEIEDFDTDPEASLRQTKRRSPLDNSAYEIWEYDVRGDPLIPDYGQVATDSGLKFIFVDELGFGDYHLVYTTLAGGMR